MVATRILTPHCARNRPRAPPHSATNVLSVRSCRATRQRLAPIARRTLISFRRVGRARQQQIRDVGGGNQQKATYGAPGNKKIQAKAAGNQLLLKGCGVNGNVEILVSGIVAPIARIGHGERGLTLVDVGALLEASDDGEVSSTAAHAGGEKCSSVGDARSPHVNRFAQELEARGEYADDRMGDAIDTQGAVDYVGIGIEVAFPIVMAENDQRSSGGAIFVRSKRPAKDRLDSKHGKEIRGDATSFDALRLAGDRCGDTFVIISGDSLERARLIPNHLVAGIRERVGYPGLAFTKKDQSAGLGIGQSTEEGGIDERKNRSIGADRDCEGADGRGSEEAVSTENAGRITEVLRDGLDHRESLPWPEYNL